MHSYCAGDAELADLAEDLFDSAVEHALRVLLPRVGVEELLDLRHAAVGLGAEAQLDLDEGLEARVEVGHTQVDELRQFGEELLIERFVGRAGEFGVALGAGELGRVFVGLFDEFLDAGAGRVVVEEFVVAFFYAYGRDYVEW